MKNLLENYKKHQIRFLEINSCKDKKIRNLRLESLETDMESTYSIPRIGKDNIVAFAHSPDFEDIYTLYLKVKNSRWVG